MTSLGAITPPPRNRIMAVNPMRLAAFSTAAGKVLPVQLETSGFPNLMAYRASQPPSTATIDP